MSKLKKFTVHLHATFTPTAATDGGKVMVVMGEPEVTECDCEPTPARIAVRQTEFGSGDFLRAVQRAQEEDK